MRKKYWDPVKAEIKLWVPQNEGKISSLPEEILSSQEGRFSVGSVSMWHGHIL